jgi:hypothetical protein
MYICMLVANTINIRVVASNNASLNATGLVAHAIWSFAALQANPGAPLAAARHLFAAERDLQGAEQWLIDNGKRYSSSCSGIYSIPGKLDHPL